MFEKLKKAWLDLNRPIYTGKRLEENLRTLATVASFTALLGLILVILDFKTRPGMLIPSLATFLGGAGCAFCCIVLKNRELAGMIPTVFCLVAFTAYTLTGAAGGTAILWSMLAPIGLCYFVSVRNGIIISLYYIVYFFFIFYSPARSHVARYYTRTFMMRFPLIFASMAIFTAIAMIHYHRSVLFENDYAERLSEEVEKQTRVARERADRLETLSEEMVQTLAVTIDAKDRYTNGHSFRVSKYSTALARQLGWPEEEIKELEREALLHDIGKIGIPDSVLNKPGKLTNEEFETIKSHTTIGGKILSISAGLEQAAQVARHHHERYDGSGYPDHLKGSAVPLHARVCAIADAYDAMNSNRIYRKSLTRERILEELEKGRGRQFDPLLLDVFMTMLKSGELDEIEASAVIPEGITEAVS